MKRLGIALALSATTFGAHAAGLGRLNLMSGLGQPLRAEIELTSIARDEAGTLTARLAGADAFSQAGIEYGAALSSLRFSIQRRGNGSQYVLVTSNAQVNEPFLDLLVELNWGSGRLVREYTVLLDPPETRTAQQVDPAATIVAAQAPAAPTVVRRTPRADAAPADSAPAPAPIAAPTRRAPVAAVPSSASGTDYVVQNGDTAMSIARATKADNVSLEQMLAVLYRDNPQAFGGNINKLLAGASMKIPDAAAVQGVDSGEARRVIAQSSNFGAYRERVARGAADAPAARSSSQQASGRLSTQVQDQGAPTAAADRLQLSRPDATRPSTGTGGTRTGAAAGPSADELAAKDRELSETRTRLALLEKNVSDLQELLKLKNQTLADLQKAGGTAPSTAPAPAAAVATPTPAPVVAPTPVTPPVPAATAPAPVPTPAPAAATPTPAPVAPAPAATAPAPNAATGSWTDWVVDNVLLVAGFAILLLLLVGYFVVRRRKMSSRFEDSIFVDNSVLHANSVFGTTGGQSVDTANTGFHSNFVPVAGTLPEHNEVDPVAEADVYIAYGRDAQAEEILKEALRADATRHAVRLKLLEIYAKRGDAKTFETMASELYAATGGQGDDWRQAAALGASIDPRNPLYGESGAAAPAAAPTYSPPAAAAPMRAPAPAPAFAATDVNSPDALDFGISSIGITPSALGGDPDETVAVKGSTDHLRTDPMPRGPSASSPSMDLDFDLGNAGGPTPLQAAVPTAPAHDDAFDFTTSAASKPLADPFTASAFGAIDPAARTAVNLPAFRARADEPATPPSPATDGFTASDIFGSSIVADDSFGSAPTEIAPTGSPNTSSITAAAAARTMDFRHAVDNHQFDKTEPLDAFSKINLDLDDGDFPAVDGKTDFGNKTDVWQAMATKLDLALAYSDIGDKDGARELLEEVVRNGDQVQAERAKHLITELG